MSVSPPFYRREFPRGTPFEPIPESFNEKIQSAYQRSLISDSAPIQIPKPTDKLIHKQKDQATLRPTPSNFTQFIPPYGMFPIFSVVPEDTFAALKPAAKPIEMPPTPRLSSLTQLSPYDYPHRISETKSKKKSALAYEKTVRQRSAPARTQKENIPPKLSIYGRNDVNFRKKLIDAIEYHNRINRQPEPPLQFRLEN